MRAEVRANVRRGGTYVTIKTEMECGTAIASKPWKTHVLLRMVIMQFSANFVSTVLMLLSLW